MNTRQNIAYTLIWIAILAIALTGASILTNIIPIIALFATVAVITFSTALVLNRTR